MLTFRQQLLAFVFIFIVSFIYYDIYMYYLAVFTTLPLFNLLVVPAPHSVVTLSRPPSISLKITDRSFKYAPPRV